MPPVRAKGTTLIATLRHLQDRYGPEAVEKCAAGLPESMRLQVRNGLLASTWYLFSDLLTLMRAAEREYGSREPKILWNIGRASADYGLNSIYRVFMKVGSPQFIINKAMTVFPNYYDQGDFKTLKVEPGYALGELSKFPEPAAELCTRILGFFERMLELTGVGSIELTHPECVAKGGKVCRYEGRWKAA